MHEFNLLKSSCSERFSENKRFRQISRDFLKTKTEVRIINDPGSR